MFTEISTLLTNPTSISTPLPQGNAKCTEAVRFVINEKRQEASSRYLQIETTQLRYENIKRQSGCMLSM